MCDKVISRKLLINPEVEGMSRTISSSYYKTSLANYLATTGSCANAVLIISDKIIKLGNLQIKGRIEQQTRVYSTKGISPTLNSAMGHGGNCIPLFLIVKET